MVSRRRFLTVGVVATAGVVSTGIFGNVPGVGSFAKGPRLQSGISADSIRRNIGKSFMIRDHQNGRNSYLKLVEVKEFSNPSDHALGIESESFSLLFEGNKQNLLNQGVYEFTHKSMPDTEILVVPVTREPGIYEVNFNSLKT